MPSGPGVIDDALIAEIAATVPPPVATFLLTSEIRADAIIDHVRRCGTNTVQLVDRVEEGAHLVMRRALPQVKIVQVLHVADPMSSTRRARWRAWSMPFCSTPATPNLMVKELGGTGRVHDWDLSRRIVEAVDRPVFLAGGLRADNVAEAVARVRPFGLDLCSSVRSQGRLDGDKLAAFFSAVNHATA